MPKTLDPWQVHFPAMFRALADPACLDSMPRPVDSGHEYALSTWGALHHALTCLLGWTDVGRGLAWWYAAGQPVADSDVLALVKAIWGEDHLIDYYAAWAWKPTDTGWMSVPPSDSPHGPSPTWLARSSHWADEDWWRRFLRRGQVHRHDPFYGGSDALHLSVHSGREDSTPSTKPLVHVLPEHRRVALVTEGVVHWLADLDVLAAQLPSLDGRSWRVEVFDRSAGWLGEYRRSRVTGRWFRGKHSIHMHGAPLADPTPA